MAKKLHRLTAYNILCSCSFSIRILLFWNLWSSTMFDGGNFVAQRQRNKESSLTERSDPFEWFTIFGVGFIFHFIYYLRRFSYFFFLWPRAVAFFFDISIAIAISTDFPVLWTIMFYLHHFEMILSVINLIFFGCLFFHKTCIIILPLSWWLWKWLRWRPVVLCCCLHLYSFGRIESNQIESEKYEQQITFKWKNRMQRKRKTDKSWGNAMGFLSVSTHKTLLLRCFCFMGNCFCTFCCWCPVTRYQIHQIVYVTECWGEILPKRKYVNQTDSRIVVSLCERKCACALAYLIFGSFHHLCISFSLSFFSTLASKIVPSATVRILWPFSFFVSLSVFEFDHGLFIAILLAKITRSSFLLIFSNLSRLMWISVFSVVWQFSKVLFVRNRTSQMCKCFVQQSAAKVYPFKCGHWG